MRWLHILFFVMLVGFAVVQYNDPDSIYWALVYLLAAFWSAMAAWRSDLLRSAGWALPGALATCVALVIGFLWLAPTISANWIHVEEARESLGYLIAAATTLFAILQPRLGTRHPSRVAA